MVGEFFIFLFLVYDYVRRSNVKLRSSSDLSFELYFLSCFGVRCESISIVELFVSENMHGQAGLIAEELRVLQEKVSLLTQQLCLLLRVREGDRVRVQWVFGGRSVTKVGVVRVLTEFTFFLELATGALLLVEDVKHLEIMQSMSED